MAKGFPRLSLVVRCWLGVVMVVFGIVVCVAIIAVVVVVVEASYYDFNC